MKKKLRDLKWGEIEYLQRIAEEKEVMTEYEFACAMQTLLVAKETYLMDVGTPQMAYAIIFQKLLEKIQENPKAWEKFII